MPILNDTPVTIPAIQEKTFEELFIYNLIVHAPAIDAGRIRIELLPFNGQTGELGPFENLQTLETNELWKIVAEVPEVQMAFGAIINAIPAVKNWIKAEEAKKLENL
jgi:hypothetical protein